MYNKVFLIGNLARDPELRYTPSGIPVAHFAIAVNRSGRKDSQGKNEVDFINVVAWRRLAEICGEFLKKAGRSRSKGASRSGRMRKTERKRHLLKWLLKTCKCSGKKRAALRLVMFRTRKKAKKKYLFKGGE